MSMIDPAVREAARLDRLTWRFIDRYNAMIHDERPMSAVSCERDIRAIEASAGRLMIELPRLLERKRPVLDAESADLYERAVARVVRDQYLDGATLMTEVLAAA
jgi:hypothetical protein